MLPRFDRRQLVVLGTCGAAQLLVVAFVSAEQPTGGTVAIIAALVLAPASVAGVAAAAARVAAAWFGVAAAGVLVVMPLLGNRFVIPADRADYDRHALPALLGLHTPGMLALGVVAVWAIALLPEHVAAGLSVIGLAIALVVWSPDALGDVKPMLHETAWSVALPQWVIVATIAGAIFRRPFLGIALGGAAVTVILRAAHEPYGHTGFGFWRALAPLVPVGAVLLSSLWFLVPRLRTRPARDSLSAN